MILGGALLLLLSSGCVTPIAYQEAWKPAWRNASKNETRASCHYPGDAETWLELRYNESNVFVGDQRLGVRVREDSHAWKLMLNEARDRALFRSDEVLLAYECDPEVVVGKEHRNLTGLLLVRSGDGGAVLLRGPFGWSRESCPDFAYRRRSVLKRIGVAVVYGPLVGLAVLADTIGVATVLAAIGGLIYLGASSGGSCH